MKNSFYRVERWWNAAIGEAPGNIDNEENWFLYRSHNFQTMEEVESYIKKHNSTYRLVVFKVEEEFIQKIEPTYEGCLTAEEMKDFEENPALLSEEIEQIRKEWTE